MGGNANSTKTSDGNFQRNGWATGISRWERSARVAGLPLGLELDFADSLPKAPILHPPWTWAEKRMESLRRHFSNTVSCVGSFCLFSDIQFYSDNQININAGVL